MLKIYDCSNSKERPKHRKDSLCPIENTIVRDLKKYANNFNCIFVKNIGDADIIFTNDIFPKNIISLKIPKIKRMDGIFSQNNLKDRNILLNESARKADYVIFISEFSKKTYFKLYKNKLKNHSIILNNVDNKKFTLNKKKNGRIKTFACSASNWTRKEKRLNSIIDFARNIVEKINLIGKCDFELPKNIIKHGYCSEIKINEILNQSDAFLNFSYKDPAPKTVCQAVSKGLPILYADSGGVNELIYSGLGIPDNKIIRFENGIPFIGWETINLYYNIFKKDYPILQKNAQQNDGNYLETIEEYFNIFKEVYNKKKLLIDKAFGILTRNALDEKLAKIDTKFNCIFLDINNLKNLNNLLGYNKVNNIIRELFGTFNFNEKILVGRWFCGDEIAIITFKKPEILIGRLRKHFQKKGISFKYNIFCNIKNTDIDILLNKYKEINNCNEE